MSGGGNVPAVAGIEVRAAVAADLPQIAAVALATGQDEEWAGADPAYMTHLLSHGVLARGMWYVGARAGAGTGAWHVRPLRASRRGVPAVLGRGLGQGAGPALQHGRAREGLIAAAAVRREAAGGPELAVLAGKRLLRGRRPGRGGFCGNTAEAGRGGARRP